MGNTSTCPKCVFLAVALAILSCLPVALAAETGFRRIPVDAYVNKMKAAWIGQMAAVGWGQRSPRWQTNILPIEAVPKWEPRIVNQFFQDDIYLDVTFLRTLQLYGLDVSMRQAGIDFANSGYRLWHANLSARENLRNGIAPPDSGHPKFNTHSDDIDYQIESDYAGLISPGLPNSVIRLGELFGRLMNYGDGVYGGQFVGGMYTEAFFENDMERVVRAGLRCVPEKSQYHEAISDVLRWHKENPNDWQKTWALIDRKYRQNLDYRRATCFKLGEGDIDAKLNGAYVALGLLYGDRDLDKTIVTTMRCGQDSDCTSSTAAGVLFTTVGFSNLPERYTAALDEEKVFSHGAYNFPQLVGVCELLARQVVLREGGRIEKDEQGREVFVIPVEEPKPSALQQSWEPGPIANCRYTEGELKMINPPITGRVDISADLERFSPGWKIKNCGSYRNPGYHKTLLGKVSVLATHPLDAETPCVLSKRVKIREGTKTILRLVVGHDHPGDWQLIVRADGMELLNQEVGPKTAEENWMEVAVDLSAYAGRTINLELINAQNDKDWEAAFWAEISLDEAQAKEENAKAYQFEAEVSKSVALNYLLYFPSEYERSETGWPLLMWLHGDGGQADRGGMREIRSYGPPKLAEEGRNFPFILLAPQLWGDVHWDPDTLHALLKEIIRKHHVDEDRVYLMGYSRGGFGAWELGCSYPDTFAAVVPISGRAMTAVERLKECAIWIFHGKNDRGVPVGPAKIMYRELKSVGAAVRMTIYPDVGHSAVSQVMETEELWEWLVAQRRRIAS